MATFQLKRHIPRRVDEVFAYVRDFRNAPQWQTGIEEIQVFPDAPVERGSVIMERRRVQGHVIDLAYKVVGLEPDRSISLESTSGPVHYSVVQTFTAEGEGTRLSLALDVDLLGGLRLMAGVLTPAVRRQAENDLDRLTDLLKVGT
jgi:uncharacterized membrane protein